MSRVRRSTYTFASGLVYSLITVVVGFIAVPLLLRWLGEEAFGAYRATLDWFGHLMLLELGLAGALRPMFVRALTDNDDAGVTGALYAGIRAYLGVTGIMVAIGVLLAAAIRVVVPVSDALAADLRLGAAVAVVALLLTPLSPYRALAEARQRGYVIHVLLLLQSLLTTALALLLAWQGYGIAGQFFAGLIGLLGFHVLLHTSERRWRAAGWFRAIRQSVKSTEWRELWKLNTPTFIRQLSGRASFMSDRIIVAAFLGPRAVVLFYITQRLADLAHQQLVGISNSSWAALAQLYASKKTDVFNKRLTQLTQMTTIFSVAALVPISVFNENFVSLWVGMDRYGGGSVTYLASAHAYLLAIYALWSWCFDATGHVERLVPMSIAIMVTNVASSIAFVLSIGLAGPLLGSAISLGLVGLTMLPWHLRSTFATSPIALFKAIAVPLVVGVPFTLALVWIGRVVGAMGWFELAALMAGSVASYLVIAWFVVLGSAERAEYRLIFTSLSNAGRE